MAAINLDIGGNTRRLDKDIQKTVNRVYAINLKTKGDQPLGRITGQVNEFNKSLAASNARVIAFGASAGLIFGLQRAFSALVSSTIEVQKSLQDINVILNVSTAQLNQFGSELFNIAKNTGQSFSEVAKAATEFSRQGLGVAETLKRTNEALILSRLSGLDTAKSVEALTAAVNSFASQAVTATEVVNKFANVDAAFAVSSKDLAEALARVGSSAAQSGVSLNELIAIVTSAQQTTARGGAVIGNSFKTIFTRLQRSKVVDLLGTLGISDTNASGELKSTIQLLQDLGKVYDTLGARQQAAVAEQVGGVFQINILKAALADLGKEYSIYNSALDVASSTTDQAIRRNEELNKTYSAQINALRENAKQLATNAGGRLLGPTFERVVGGANELLGGINESDGKGVGAALGKGVLDGLGQILSGPGLILIGGVLLKLTKDFSVFATGSAKSLLGLNTAAEQQKNIQTSITQILAKNPDLLKLALKGEEGLNAVANTLLQNLRSQTVELQKQAQVAAQIAKAFYGAGVRISGDVPVVPTGGSTRSSTGRPPGKAAGFIPRTRNPEIQAARDEKYSAQRSFEVNNPILGPINVNNREKTNAVPVDNYPPGSLVVNPNQLNQVRGIPLTPIEKMKNKASGFIPNFAPKSTTGENRIFSAGRVFENALGFATRIQTEYKEDNNILDFEPSVFANVSPKIKKELGLNNLTNYGDAKLSDKPGNLTSYLSKIIRYDAGVKGVKKIGAINNKNSQFNLKQKRSRSGASINLLPPPGGSILLPGKPGLENSDRLVVAKASLQELLKRNPSLSSVLTGSQNKYGIEPGENPSFMARVLLERTSIPLSGTYGAKTREEKEALSKKLAGFASGFIPNFAAALAIPTKGQLTSLGMTIGEYKKLPPRDKDDVDRAIGNLGKGYRERTEGLKPTAGQETINKIQKQAGNRSIYTYVLDDAGKIYYDRKQRQHHIETAYQNRVEKYVRGYFANPPPEVLPFANGSDSPSSKTFKKITSNKAGLTQRLAKIFTKPQNFGASTQTRSMLNAQNPGPYPVNHFSEGFIPNFAKATQAVNLDDISTNRSYSTKLVSAIIPQPTNELLKFPAQAEYRGTLYRTNDLPVSGPNRDVTKKLSQQNIPNLNRNIGKVIVDQANVFGQSLGATKFMSSASELPNLGGVNSAVGVAFEGGVANALGQSVGSKNARVDFTSKALNPKIKKIFNNAPGSYEAKYRPSTPLINDVFSKFLSRLKPTKPGEIKAASSGAAGKAYLAARSAEVAKIREQFKAKKGREPYSKEINKELALRGIPSRAAGFIPNFAGFSFKDGNLAPIVRATDDKELKLMFSQFSRGLPFQHMSYDTGAAMYNPPLTPGGPAKGMYGFASSEPGYLEKNQKAAFKQNLLRGKNWSTSRPNSKWLVKYNRNKLDEKEILPDPEARGASIYGKAVNKNQIIWPIKQANGPGKIFEKDIPAFLSGKFDEKTKGKMGKNFAAGFIPNFASANFASANFARAKAVSRKTENESNGNSGAQFVKNSPIGAFYKTPGQSSNLDTLIRRDHPEGLNAALQTSFANQRKGKAQGFIPNFAPTNDVTPTGIGDTIGALLAQGAILGLVLQNFSADVTAANAAMLEYRTSLLAKQNAELQNLEKGSAAYNKLEKQIDKTNKSIDKLGKGNTAAAYGQAASSALLIAGPIIAETIKNAIGQESKTARIAGEGVSAVGNVVSTAALAATLAPQGKGGKFAIFAAVGTALLSSVGIIKQFNTSLPELGRAAQEASEKLSTFSGFSQETLKTFEQISEFRGRGQAENAGKLQTKLLTDVGTRVEDPAVRARIQTAIINQDSQALQKAIDLNTQALTEANQKADREVVIESSIEKIKAESGGGFFEGLGNIFTSQSDIDKRNKKRQDKQRSQAQTLFSPQIETTVKRTNEKNENIPVREQISQLQELALKARSSSEGYIEALEELGFTTEQIKKLSKSQAETQPLLIKTLNQEIENRQQILLNTSEGNAVIAQINKSLEVVKKTYAKYAKAVDAATKAQIALKVGVEGSLRNIETARLQSQAELTSDFIGETAPDSIRASITAGRSKIDTDFKNSVSEQIIEALSSLADIYISGRDKAFSDKATIGDEGEQKAAQNFEDLRAFLESPDLQSGLEIDNLRKTLGLENFKLENFEGFKVNEIISGITPVGTEGQKKLDELEQKLIQVNATLLESKRIQGEQRAILARQKFTEIAKQFIAAAKTSFGGFETFLQDGGYSELLKPLQKALGPLGISGTNTGGQINQAQELARVVTELSKLAGQNIGPALGADSNVVKTIQSAQASEIEKVLDTIFKDLKDVPNGQELAEAFRTTLATKFFGPDGADASNKEIAAATAEAQTKAQFQLIPDIQKRILEAAGGQLKGFDEELAKLLDDPSAAFLEAEDVSRLLDGQRNKLLGDILEELKRRPMTNTVTIPTPATQSGRGRAGGGGGGRRSAAVTPSAPVNPGYRGPAYDDGGFAGGFFPAVANTREYVIPNFAQQREQLFKQEKRDQLKNGYNGGKPVMLGKNDLNPLRDVIANPMQMALFEGMKSKKITSAGGFVPKGVAGNSGSRLGMPHRDPKGRSGVTWSGVAGSSGSRLGMAPNSGNQNIGQKLRSMASEIENMNNYSGAISRFAGGYFPNFAFIPQERLNKLINMVRNGTPAERNNAWAAIKRLEKDGKIPPGGLSGGLPSDSKPKPGKGPTLALPAPAGPASKATQPWWKKAAKVAKKIPYVGTAITAGLAFSNYNDRASNGMSPTEAIVRAGLEVGGGVLGGFAGVLAGGGFGSVVTGALGAVGGAELGSVIGDLIYGPEATELDPVLFPDQKPPTKRPQPKDPTKILEQNLPKDKELTRDLKWQKVPNKDKVLDNRRTASEKEINAQLIRWSMGADAEFKNYDKDYKETGIIDVYGAQGEVARGSNIDLTKRINELRSRLKESTSFSEGSSRDATARQIIALQNRMRSEILPTNQSKKQVGINPSGAQSLIDRSIAQGATLDGRELKGRDFTGLTRAITNDKGEVGYSRNNPEAAKKYREYSGAPGVYVDGKLWEDPSAEAVDSKKPKKPKKSTAAGGYFPNFAKEKERSPVLDSVGFDDLADPMLLFGKQLYDNLYEKQRAKKFAGGNRFSDPQLLKKAPPPINPKAVGLSIIPAIIAESATQQGFNATRGGEYSENPYLANLEKTFSRAVGGATGGTIASGPAGAIPGAMFGLGYDAAENILGSLGMLFELGKVSYDNYQSDRKFEQTKKSTQRRNFAGGYFPNFARRGRGRGGRGRGGRGRGGRGQGGRGTVPPTPLPKEEKGLLGLLKRYSTAFKDNKLAKFVASNKTLVGGNVSLAVAAGLASYGNRTSKGMGKWEAGVRSALEAGLGFGGGVLVGKTGAKAGGLIGAAGGPVALAGAAAGGVVGSTAGYYGGSVLGGYIGDAIFGTEKERPLDSILFPKEPPKKVSAPREILQRKEQQPPETIGIESQGIPAQKTPTPDKSFEDKRAAAEKEINAQLMRWSMGASAGFKNYDKDYNETGITDLYGMEGEVARGSSIETTKKINELRGRLKGSTSFNEGPSRDATARQVMALQNRMRSEILPTNQFRGQLGTTPSGSQSLIDRSIAQGTALNNIELKGRDFTGLTRAITNAKGEVVGYSRDNPEAAKKYREYSGAPGVYVDGKLWEDPNAEAVDPYRLIGGKGNAPATQINTKTGTGTMVPRAEALKSFPQDQTAKLERTFLKESREANVPMKDVYVVQTKELGPVVGNKEQEKSIQELKKAIKEKTGKSVSIGGGGQFGGGGASGTWAGGYFPNFAQENEVGGKNINVSIGDIQISTNGAGSEINKDVLASQIKELIISQLPNLPELQQKVARLQEVSDKITAKDPALRSPPRGFIATT